MMTPVICIGDYRLLKDLVTQTNVPAHAGRRMLGEEIMRASVVPDGELVPGTVRLNSEVEVLETRSGRKIIFRLVLPEIADVQARRISIFAPLSVALLGYRENDTVTCQLPEGETKFRILRVKNEY